LDFGRVDGGDRVGRRVVGGVDGGWGRLNNMYK
jgi:hypothetical protein